MIGVAFFKDGKDPKSVVGSQFFNFIDMTEADRPNGKCEGVLYELKKDCENKFIGIGDKVLLKFTRLQNMLMALTLLLFKKSLSFDFKQIP